MIDFNADEVFEMAEKIERNGGKYYRKAARSVSKSCAELFLKLADMEIEHEKTFHQMRVDLARDEKAPVTADPDGVEGQYLEVLADGKVFDFSADPSEKLTGRETPQEVLQTAIGLEKDSITFYVGMKELIPPGKGRDKIDRIVAQELSHIIILSRELAKVNLQR